MEEKEIGNENTEINCAYTDKYKEYRKKVEDFIYTCPVIENCIKKCVSPSEKYYLIMTPYQTGKGFWNYIIGEIFDNNDEKMFTIIRNYGSFWYKWIEHQNGKEYLLCGEDYQGYVAINLTDKKKNVFFPENGFKGWGFCWTKVSDYNKDIDKSIKVEGCYWGAPYEIVEFDFSDPDILPYKEIKREYIEIEDEEGDR